MRYFVLVLLVAAAIGCIEKLDEPADLPACSGCNLILISIDTLRADHLGYTGYVRNTSAFMDSMSEKTITFENAYVQWPRTSQSMASMLTGKYPSQTDVLGLRTEIKPENTLISEILKERGYSTTGVVTNGNLGKHYGFDQGFDQFYELWKGANNGGQRDSYAAERVNKQVNSILDQNRSGFFLWIHYIDPHGPYVPKNGWQFKFVNDSHYNKNRRIPRKIVPPYQYLKREGSVDVDYYTAQYDGEIGYVDSYLKRLFERLGEKNLMNNTIVVITADHGESLDEHYSYFEHGQTLFQENIRVPLMIYHPHMSPKRIKQPVALIDLVPTLLDMLNVQVDEKEIAGHSLTKLIMTGTEEQKPIFTEIEDIYATVYGEHKLIYYERKNKTKLFNLEKDKMEKTPIKDTQTTQKLYNMIKHWRQTSKEKTKTKQDKTDKNKKPDKQTLKQLKELGYVS